MVRKKKTIVPSKTKKQIKARKSAAVQKQTWFRFGESYSSLLLGIVVVIVLVLFGASLIKVQHQQDTSSISITALPTDVALKTTPSPTSGQNGQKTYVVANGDTLWSISEKFYGSGYNWEELAKANNITDADFINPGTILAIPEIIPSPTATPTVTPIPTSAGTAPLAIKSDSYTVESGDSLWDIAVRAYADGFRWTDIAKVNNLANPDLIFSGNILRIPR